MRFWWVNHKQTYKQETSGGFLWSPKSGPRKNLFWDNMAKVEPGDVIFSYAFGQIQAVGRATAKAQTAPQPDFGKAGDAWDYIGWYLPTEFHFLQKPVRPKDHMDVLQPLLPEKYGPIQANGNGNQGAYLSSVPDVMANAIIALIGPEYATAFADLEIDIAPTVEQEAEEDIQAELNRKDVPAVEIQQLVMARRGQGLFKARVRQHENACRITGVAEIAHLRASHIKPWRDSTDVEKLDGDNGLLLAPHVDHLFDRGFLSFTDDGDIILAPTMDKHTLDRWHIDWTRNVGPFSPEQAVFLAFHRAEKLQT